MYLIDTHCHIHDSEFLLKFGVSADVLVSNASEAGVKELICVGTSLKSSQEAVKFCETRENCYFSLALHPHEATDKSESELKSDVDALLKIASNNPVSLVAIGETGLDYYYHKEETVRRKQEILFRLHIEMALSLKLPMIFHVREAFDDFFRIIDEYKSITGVVHSFSANLELVNEVVKRGLYVGLNGIMTFTTDDEQLSAAQAVPIEKLLLETDSPFLTPNPLRGTMNEPKHVILVTQFLSKLRDESQALLAKQTTVNAKKLFQLK